MAEHEPFQTDESIPNGIESQTLLAMFDNLGVVHCYGADPELTPAVRSADCPLTLQILFC